MKYMANHCYSSFVHVSVAMQVSSQSTDTPWCMLLCIGYCVLVIVYYVVLYVILSNWLLCACAELHKYQSFL